MVIAGMKESDQPEQDRSFDPQSAGSNSGLPENVEKELKFWRRRQVCERVGVSPTTIHRWVADGSFPAPMRIGSMSRWRSTEVLAWMQKVSDNDRDQSRAA